MSSRGYPGKYSTGLPINGLPNSAVSNLSPVFHAGTSWKNDQIVTSGGRVLGGTALSSTLAQARSQAYETVKTINFEGQYCREDIASFVLY